MNQRLYRIVFNKARGLLMVAAENAVARHGGGDRCERRLSPIRVLARLDTLTLAVMLACGSLSFAAQAEIREDTNAPGQQQPDVLKAANGTPQVNIQTPNSEGVSHNKYSQFDVGPEGVILNNSRQPTATKQGGYVDGNPWLARGEAQVILNEVNARDPSKLNGWIEVAGKRADVIIANPAGITCDGCGFINADRGVLSTGQPILENGRLKGFDVDKGALTVDGKGLDARGTRHTDLIARTVKLNAEVHAQDLTVTTGRNRVDVQTAGKTDATAKGDDGSKQPKVALDVSALGGMYAQRIRLVGTEQGLGVANAGTLDASAGDVVVNAAGQLDNSGLIHARDNVSLAARQTIDNQGRVLSEQQIDVQTPEALRNSGVIAAGHDTTLKAGDISGTHQSALAAGVDREGKLTQAGTLTVESRGALTGHGQHLATDQVALSGQAVTLTDAQVSGRDVAIEAQQGLDSSRAIVRAAQGLTVKAAQPVINRAGQWAAERVVFTAPALDNTDGFIHQRGKGALSLDTERFDNTRGTLVNDGEQLSVKAHQLTNTDGTIVGKGDNLTVTADQLDNTRGRIESARHLTVTAPRLDNTHGRLLAADQGNLDITAVTALNNEAGQLLAGQQLAARTQGALTNTDGAISGGSETRLDAQTLDNIRGRIHSRGDDLHVHTQALDNRDGQLQAERDLTLDVAALHQDGRAVAGRDARITTQRYTANDRSVTAAGIDASGQATRPGSLTITADDALDDHGTRLAHDRIQLDGAALDLTGSRAQADHQQLTARSGDIDASGATLIAHDTLQATTPGTLRLRQGQGQAKQLLLKASHLDNTQGQLRHTGPDALRLDLLTFNNVDGVLFSGAADTALEATQLDNTRGVIAGQGGLHLATQTLDNTDGRVQQAGTGDLSLRGEKLTGTRGTLAAEGALTLEAGQADLTHAKTVADRITLKAQQLDHQGGTLVQRGEGPMTLDVRDALDNRKGAIESNGDVTLTAGTVDNAQGRIFNVGAHDLALTTSRQNNTDGVVAAGRHLMLDSGTLDNTQGVVRAGDNAHLISETLTNTRGQISAGTLNARVDNVDNDAGLLHARDDLTLDAHRVLNQNSNEQGGIVSQGALTLNANTLSQQAGVLLAQGDLAVTAGNIDNDARSRIGSTGARVNVDARGTFDQAGQLQAAENMTVSAQRLNHSGRMTAGHNLALKASQLTASDEAVMAAGVDRDGALTQAGNLMVEAPQAAVHGRVLAHDHVTVKGDRLDLDRARISGQDMTLAAEDILSTRQAQLAAQHVMQGKAGREIDNQQGQWRAEQLVFDTPSLINRQGTLIATGNAPLTYRGERLDNHQGRIVSQADDTRINVHTLDNASGLIAANGHRLEVIAQQLDNREGTMQLAGEGPFTLVADRLDGTQGKLLSRGALSIEGKALTLDRALTVADALRVKGDTLSHQGGTLVQQGTASPLSITLDQSLDNRGGTLESARDLALNTGRFDNTDGRVLAADQGDLRIAASQATDNTRGRLEAGHDLFLDGTSLNNTQGRIVAGQQAHLGLSSGLENAQGVIASQGLELSTQGDLGNRTGLISSLGAMHLDTHGHRLDNRESGDKGGILAQGPLTLASGALDNRQGVITGREALALTTAGLDNRGGTLLTPHGAQLSTQALDNAGGLIEAGTQLTVDTHGQQLNNRDSGAQGGLIGREGVRIDSGAFDNTRGAVQGARVHIDTQRQALDNTQGQLIGRDALTLITGETNNTAGLIQSNGAMKVDTDRATLINRDSGDKGGISARQLDMRTGALDNTHGVIVSEAARVDARQVTNQDGVMAARDGDLALTSTGLDNTHGLVQARRHLMLDTQGGRLDNHGQAEGQGIIAQGALTLSSGDLDNQQGRLHSGDALTLTSGDLDNRDGQLTSRQGMQLTTRAFDNTHGLLQSGGALHLDTQGARLTNTASGQQQGIIAHGPLTLTSGDLNNRTGFIASQQQALLNTQALDNTQGTIAGNQGLLILSQALDNSAGHLQTPGRLQLDTRGQVLNNHQGQLIGEQAVNARSGAFDNTDGTINSGHDVSLDTQHARLDNQRGQITSGDTLNIAAGDLDNRTGQIQTAGEGQLSANTLDNRQGLLRSGTALHLNANRLDNRDTRRDDQGIEAPTVTFNGQTLDNDGGAVRGRDQVTLDVGQTLNNAQGLVSSQHDLMIRGPLEALSIRNQDGTLIAGRSLVMQGRTLSGNGKVLSQQDLDLTLGQDITVDGDMIANRHLGLHTRGNVVNRHVLKAGETLTVDAGTLDNQASGEIASQKTTLNADRLINRGLIDGTLTYVKAGQLDNLGTGRIYGDQLAIQANTLNNLNEGGKSPVIAARERLDLGVGTLTNRDHGLIYSQGDMAIKGGLDDQHRATGRAREINNLSATIEAMGNLEIDAEQINNRDLHVKVSEPEQVKSEHKHEYSTSDSGERMDASTVRIGHAKHDRIQLEYGSNYSQIAQNYVEYQYDRVTLEGKVTEQDPSVIRSGHDLKLSGGTLNSYNGKVLAGDALLLNNLNVNNEGVKVPHREVDGVMRTVWPQKQELQPVFKRSKKKRLVWVDDYSKPSYQEMGPGKVTHYWPSSRRTGGKLNRGHKDTTDSSTADYGPFTHEHDAYLSTSQYQGQLHLTPNKRDISKAATGQLHDSIAGIQNVGIDAQQTAINTPALAIVNVSPLSGRSVDLRNASLARGAAAEAVSGRQGAASGSVNVPDITVQPDRLVTDAMMSAERAPAGTILEVEVPLVTRPDDQNTQLVPHVTPASSGDHAAVIPTDMIVRAVKPKVELPDNSLFTLRPESQSHYLIETDPRFTQYRQWLGTDYMQNQLRNRPENDHKRLGDGFYEQRLVREQVMKLTGQRYLAGYNNDEEQLKTLMDAGIAFGNQHGLKAGVALSPEQMALLTSDMVWLVDQDVTLADGTQQKVLVPQVYARLHKGDLTGQGTLLNGRTVQGDLRDLTNSGQIAGRELTALSTDSLTNRNLISGGQVELAARGDIRNLGGQIEGGDRVNLRAGHDIEHRSTEGANDTQHYLNRQAGIYVKNDKGELALQALNNITMAAADVINKGADGKTHIVAGNDLKLDTLKTSERYDFQWGSDNYLKQSTTDEVGSQVIGKGDVVLGAGRDIEARAASLLSDQTLAMQAGRDIHLQAGETTTDLETRFKTTEKGFLSKKTTITHNEVHDRTALGTSLSADQIDLRAGRDLTVQAGNVVGTHDVDLGAGRNLDVTTAAEQRDHRHMEKTTKSGLLSSGGIGFTIGKQMQQTEQEHQGALQKGSTIGSSEGSTRLVAGNDVKVHGSDVIAGQDLTLQGKNVTVEAAENATTDIQRTEFKQSGLTLALSGTVGGMLNNTVQTVQDMRDTEDGRLKALKGTQAALSGVQGVQAGRLADAQSKTPKAPLKEGESPQQGANTFAISASYGQQKSSSETRQDQTMAQGSTLGAGRDLIITATGNGEAGQGNLDVIGSQLKAGRDVGLEAAHDLNLLSSENTSKLSGHNTSSGYSIGGSIGSNGITIDASANMGRGRERGDGVTHTETQIDAGRDVVMNVGNNALLKGAQVNGDRIKANIAHNLTLQSEQDHDHYDSKQESVSVSGSVPIGAGQGTVSVSANRSTMNSDFDSVQAQTGLFAGKGGFDVHVGDHTQLDGAVIASQAEAAKNRLDTGTLGFRDIDNHAEYKVEQQSMSMSSGGNTGGQMLMNAAATVMGNLNGSDSKSSTTHAAVSDGSITVRDQANQQQNVADLSRDTDHANNALTPIFDKEKEQQRLARMQAVTQIGMQAMDIVRTQGEIEGHKAAQVEVTKLQAEHPLQYDTPEKVNTAYKQVFDEKMMKYGTGSQLQQGIQAATGALTALAGGDIQKAIAQGAAPYLATLVKQQTEYTGPNGEKDPKKDNVIANTIGHALVGGVVAHLSGQNAGAGAAGAAAGELAARAIMAEMYPGKDGKDLNESERHQLSNLSTIAAGLAGGLTGDSAASTVGGAKAGQNAVENNYLSLAQVEAWQKEREGKSGVALQEVDKRFQNMSNQQHDEMLNDCASSETCVKKYGFIGQEYDQVRQRLRDMGQTGILFFSDQREDASIVANVASAQSLSRQFGGSPVLWEMASAAISSGSDGRGGMSSGATSLAAKQKKTDAIVQQEKNKKTYYSGDSRSDAFRQAKRDAGIPTSSQPINITRPVLTDGNNKQIVNDKGQPVTTREYEFKKQDGSSVFIQDHSAGHSPAAAGHGDEPHFNVRPEKGYSEKRKGHVSGTHGHYNFPLKKL